MISVGLGPEALARVRAYGSRPNEIRLDSGATVPIRPFSWVLEDPAPSVVFHYAYLTKDRVSQTEPDAYLATNLSLTATMLSLLDRHRPEVFITASSGAAKGYAGASGYDFALNPYGSLKRLDELAFLQAAHEFGLRCAIPRVYSVAGPWMTKASEYALGGMISMARAGGPIEISAVRRVFRSYCGVDEVIALATWAAQHRPPLVFDTGGDTVEMSDLAQAVSETVGQACPIRRLQFDADAQADRYVGDPRIFNELTNESGLRLKSLRELVATTADH